MNEQDKNYAFEKIARELNAFVAEHLTWDKVKQERYALTHDDMVERIKLYAKANALLQEIDLYLAGDRWE